MEKIERWVDNNGLSHYFMVQDCIKYPVIPDDAFEVRAEKVNKDER
jgi:hypothetical protein